jgi:signal transduction histidine kinase
MTRPEVAAIEPDADRPFAPGRPRFEGLLVAIGLAVQVGITSVAARHQPQRRDIDGYAIALLALAVAALPLRRRWPVGVLAFAFVMTLTYWTADYPRGPIFFALVVALAQVVLTGHRRVAIAAIGLGFVGFTWLGPALGTQDNPALGGVIGLGAWLVALLSVMELVRSRRERAREKALSLAESLQRRASDERLRIAQELHDAVAHNISLINIHAGVALHLFDEQPQQARDALATIKQSSKEALVELRSILGLLRRADEDAPRAPTPSLSRLDELVARSNAAGVQVQIDVEGDLENLPRNVDVAAYRIIQESLTNVARHADRPDAVVRVRAVADALNVEVLDEGSGTRWAPDLPSGGNGIAGMRERATAIGGSFEAGPRPGRGFAVRARLPIERARAALQSGELETS